MKNSTPSRSNSDKISPMDIESISLNLSREEIIAAVRESRRPDRPAFEYDQLENPESAPMIKA